MNKENKTKKPIKAKEAAMYEAVMELMMEGIAPDKIKVSDITSKAGIGKGTAYGYFSSREELLGKALIYFRDRWVESVIRDLTGLPTFMDRMTYLFDLVKKDADKMHPAAFHQLCRVIFAPFGYDEMDAEMARKLAGASGQAPIYTLSVSASPLKNAKKSSEPPYMEEFYRIIEMGKESGELRRDLPNMYIAMTIIMKVIAYMSVLMLPLEQCGQSIDEETMRKLLIDSIRLEFLLK